MSPTQKSTAITVPAVDSARALVDLPLKQPISTIWDFSEAFSASHVSSASFIQPSIFSAASTASRIVVTVLPPHAQDVLSVELVNAESAPVRPRRDLDRAAVVLHAHGLDVPRSERQPRENLKAAALDVDRDDVRAARHEVDQLARCHRGDPVLIEDVVLPRGVADRADQPAGVALPELDQTGLDVDDSVHKDHARRLAVEGKQFPERLVVGLDETARPAALDEGPGVRKRDAVVCPNVEHEARILQARRDLEEQLLFEVLGVAHFVTAIRGSQPAKFDCCRRMKISLSWFQLQLASTCHHSRF